jgi:CheY-like chemotaxis protein
VFRIGTDPKDAAIVRSVVELGHNLGLRIVAEGVEDRVSWDLLQRMGCDEAQGHYLTKPIPADALTHWLTETGADAVAAGAGDTKPARPAAPSVMIVDDDQTLRRVIRHLLADNGTYAVSEAADGWEAIVLARRFQPDVILLDLSMPRMGGLAALPSIRSVAPNSRIVVLSATDDRAQLDAATEAGAIDFVDKAEGLVLLQDKVELALAS